MQDAVRGYSSTLACLLVLCTASGCAGKLDHPENFRFLLPDASVTDAGPALPPPPTCVTDLFEMSCGSAACHGQGALVMDLVSDGVANRIVNHPSNKTSVCSGRTIVATDGTQSLLLQKLTLATPPCGSQMPLGGTASPEQITCIRDWITSLNGGSTDGGTATDDGGM